MKKLQLAIIGLIMGLCYVPAFGTTLDYGVGYVHNLIQTDDSTPSDYTTGRILGNNEPGPYAFESFDNVTQVGSTSTVTLPNSTTYALTYSPDDNQFHYVSTGYSTVAAGLVDYPEGTYSVAGNGEGEGNPSGNISLTANTFPNTPQIMQINGAAAQWLGGSLILNAGQSNTITWNDFTNYSNTVGAHIDIDIYNMSGSGGTVKHVEAFTGANGSGDAPFDSLTLSLGELTSGDAYSGNIEFDWLTSDTTTSGNDDVGFDQTETFFTITAVPEPNNFWLPALVLVAMSSVFSSANPPPSKSPRLFRWRSQR